MKHVWIVKAIKGPIENIGVSEKQSIALKFCEEMLRQGHKVELLQTPLLESNLSDD